MIHFLIGLFFLAFLNQTELNINKAIDYNYVILDKNITKKKYLSTFISFIHSVIIVIWSYNIYPDYKIGYNTQTQNTFIIFYLTYFFKDIYNSYILKEYHFIYHHLISMFPGLVSLYYNKYGSFIVIGLFNAEITNPLQQLGLLIKFTNSEINVNPLFVFNNCFFIINRTFITPIIYYKLLRDLTDFNLLILFIINAVLLYTLSLYWSINLVLYKIIPLLYNQKNVREI